MFDAIVRSYDETDIVVKESLTNHIVILDGETQIVEFAYSSTEGKISNLKLLSNGDRMLYVMEKNTVPQPYSNKLMLYDISTRTTYTLMESSSHPIESVILNINNNDVIIFRESNNSLRVCSTTYTENIY